jgi:hypothetical protein
MHMKVECPNCGQWVEMVGRAVPCPNCGKIIPAVFQAPLPPRSAKAGTDPSAPLKATPVEPAPQVVYPNRYRPQPPREPMVPWVRASLILGGALASLFLIFLVAVLIIRARFAPAPAPPPPPVAVAPALAPAPTTTPAGSKLFSFADQPANGSGPDQTPKTPAPAAAPAPAGAPSPAPVETTQPASTQPLFPVAAAVPPKQEVVTDEAINNALVKGANYLLSRFDSDGRYKNPKDSHAAGIHALCTLALLHVGQAIPDERLNIHSPVMAAMLEAMKGYSVPPQIATYTHSLRAQALAVYDRKEDHADLVKETRWLISAGVKGAYTYDVPSKPATQPSEIGWDNSNSQYGALGVWAAADAGVPVPPIFWQDVQQHWEKSQDAKTGGWPYRGGAGDRTLSMTSAGVTMLFVANEQLSALRPETQIARPPFSPSLQLGLDWLAQGNNAVDLNVSYPYYTLYGMERAGLASGFKMFGKHDWFRELAANVLKSQGDNGSWGDDADTAFALLFLARGRHPLLMNKLHFIGAWANRPRDVAHLASFVSRETERALNWQVVDLKSDWSEWMDAPVLYLASHEPPIFDESDYDKLRAYVAAGGLLFTQADGGSREFNQWAELLAMKLFGQRMTDLPDNHFVYTAVYRPKQKFPLRGVSNNTRMLMIHSPTDIAKLWQARSPAEGRDVFELGANLFIYATGMDVPRNRVATPYVPPLPGEPKNVVPVVRLKYAGDWDPEPYAWVREPRLFRRETSIGLVPTPVEIEKLTTAAGPIASLTGTGAVAFTGPQVAALRDYVTNGGVLLIDSCGGGKAFNDSVAAMLATAFPGQQPALLKTDHPLLAGKGAGLTQIAKPQVRPYVFRTIGQGFPKLQILQAGKGAVLLSQLDLTSGLLGTNTLGIIGYDPAYAHAFVRNAILWTVNGRGTPPAWNPPATRPVQQAPKR